MHADMQGIGLPSAEYIELAAEMFSLLADATRLRIILAIGEGELSVNALAEHVDKSPAAVSQHLAKLRWARMVAARQDGTRVYYRLANEHARRLVTDAIFQAEHAIDEAPSHHRADSASGSAT
jgi:DNA-binding transcriptional ArsR family regulator